MTDNRVTRAWGYWRHFWTQLRINLHGVVPWYSLRNAWQSLWGWEAPSVEDMQRLFADAEPFKPAEKGGG